MKILVECLCGAAFEAAPELAGGTADCPSCRRELRVPSQEWSDKYRAALASANSDQDGQRLDGYRSIIALGTESAVPGLMRGLQDPSRACVNACLRGLMMIAPKGQEQIIELVRKDALRVGRLVAMLREENYAEGSDILCDWIDGSIFTQGQISEIIPLLGEMRRKRALATLKALRRVYPNLSVLTDDALSRFPKEAGEVDDSIPDEARKVQSSAVARVQEMAESQRTAKRSGCLGMVILLLSPAAALLAWLLW
ncbi:MAG: hypothetical protein L6Q71_05450 [Planctomycetes bacterium]|nr:hypothetical protein [Planctomycetota bacterium]NUQ33941.1 hypothetical protein [Planctomycetaceae bacterium]